MNRIVLACLAIFVLPSLSGCCCCDMHSSCGGCYSSGCSSSYGGSSSYGSYGNCLSYGDSYSTCDECGGKMSKKGNCSNCQGSDDFSLPPDPNASQMQSSYPMQSGYPVQSGVQSSVPYGTFYGPEIVGPEIVGPEYVPNGTEWQQGTPSNPVTPAAPMPPMTSPNAQTPTPIPAINSSVVVPAPAPMASPMPTGPMMPTTPPPPPEPVSQMRFRTYR